MSIQRKLNQLIKEIQAMSQAVDALTTAVNVMIGQVADAVTQFNADIAAITASSEDPQILALVAQINQASGTLHAAVTAAAAALHPSVAPPAP